MAQIYEINFEKTQTSVMDQETYQNSMVLYENKNSKDFLNFTYNLKTEGSLEETSEDESVFTMKRNRSEKNYRSAFFSPSNFYIQNKGLDEFFKKLQKEILFFCNILTGALIRFYNIRNCCSDKILEIFLEKIKDLFLRNDLYRVIYEIKSTLRMNKKNEFSANLIKLYNLKPYYFGTSPYFAQDREFRNVFRKIYQEILNENINNNPINSKFSIRHSIEVNGNFNTNNNNKSPFYKENQVFISNREDTINKTNQQASANNMVNNGNNNNNNQKTGVFHNSKTIAYNERSNMRNSNDNRKDRNKSINSNKGILNKLSKLNYSKSLKWNYTNLSGDEGSKLQGIRQNNYDREINKNILKVPFNQTLLLLRKLNDCNSILRRIDLMFMLRASILGEIDNFWENIPLKFKYRSVDADNLLSIFIYLIIKSQMTNLLIDIEIIDCFISKNIKLSRKGYFFSLFQSSIEYILDNINIQQLDLNIKEYNSNIESEISKIKKNPYDVLELDEIFRNINNNPNYVTSNNSIYNNIKNNSDNNPFIASTQNSDNDQGFTNKNFSSALIKNKEESDNSRGKQENSSNSLGHHNSSSNKILYCMMNKQPENNITHEGNISPYSSTNNINYKLFENKNKSFNQEEIIDENYRDSHNIVHVMNTITEKINASNTTNSANVKFIEDYYSEENGNNKDNSNNNADNRITNINSSEHQESELYLTVKNIDFFSEHD